MCEEGRVEEMWEVLGGEKFEERCEERVNWRSAEYR